LTPKRARVCSSATSSSDRADPLREMTRHTTPVGLDAASAACLTQRSKTFDNAHSVAWFVFHPVATFRERAR